MPELVTAIHDYAAWLYALVLLLVVRELVVMYRSGRDRARAMFGLEREAATGRAIRAVVTVVLLATIGIGVYTVSELIAPSMPERDRRLVEEAPIVEPPVPIVVPSDTPARPTGTPTVRLPLIVTATATPETAGTPILPRAACRNPDVAIVSPSPGDLLVGDTPIVVTVRFDAATGRAFSLDLGAGAEPREWTDLGGPFAEPVTESAMLSLSSQGLAPGTYTLRLILAQPDGAVPEDAECRVPVRVP